MPTVTDNASVVNRPNDSQNGGEHWPPQEKIAELAHQLWCERGREDGHADEDWIRAQKQLADRHPEVEK